MITNLLLLTAFIFATPPKDAKVQTPREIIEQFYQQYIEASTPTQRKEMSLSFSRSFHKLTSDNERLCREKAGTDVCGWNTSGDIYFDSQEYESMMTIKSSNLTITEITPTKINVRLNVYPSVKAKDGRYERDITFIMLKEVSTWVVDDILYKDKSLKKRISDENEYLKKLPKPKKPVEMHTNDVQ